MKQAHYKLEDFSQDNWKLYVAEPDPDFSPEHNYAVIQETIDDYEHLRYGLSEKVKANSEDRADILASFAKYKLDLGGEKSIEQFLGKKRMNEIYGEQLLEKLRIMKSAEKLKKGKL
jgi:hypothetical protein